MGMRVCGEGKGSAGKRKEGRTDKMNLVEQEQVRRRGVAGGRRRGRWGLVITGGRVEGSARG